jgi:basic membrane protein A
MKKTLIFLMAVLLVAPFAFAGGDQEGGTSEEVEHRIGIAFDVGGRGDRSFNDSAYRGLRRLAEEYSGFIQGDPDNVDHGNRLQLRYLEPQEGGQDREQLLRIMAEDGYGLIFGVGFAYTDTLQTVAEDFPDTHFVLIDGTIEGLTEDSNITTVTFAEHEGSFLVGALAGLWIQENSPGSKIGYIGGMDIPLIHKFHGGYMAGAMYVNENLREDGMILGQYIGQDPSAFNDPQTAQNIANNMYNNGAEIIYHAAGASGSGLFNSAYEQDKWAIGVDSDQGVAYAESDTEQEQAIAEHIMTSMLKRVDNSVFLLSEQFVQNDGELEGGHVTYGLENRGVGVAVNEYNEDLVEPYMDEINELRQQVLDGEISVPTSDEQIDQWMQETF